MGHLDIPWSLREWRGGRGGGAVARALYSLPPPQPISEPTVYPGVHGGGSSRMGEPLQPAASLHLHKPGMWLRTERQIDSWERLLG